MKSENLMEKRVWSFENIYVSVRLLWFIETNVSTF